MIYLSDRILLILSNGPGGFSARTLAALGVSWPPKKGWRKALIGKAITPEDFTIALEGKKKPKNQPKFTPKKPAAYVTHDRITAAFKAPITRPAPKES